MAPTSSERVCRWYKWCCIDPDAEQAGLITYKTTIEVEFRLLIKIVENAYFRSFGTFCVNSLSLQSSQKKHKIMFFPAREQKCEILAMFWSTVLIDRSEFVEILI